MTVVEKVRSPYSVIQARVEEESLEVFSLSEFPMQGNVQGCCHLPRQRRYHEMLNIAFLSVGGHQLRKDRQCHRLLEVNLMEAMPQKYSKDDGKGENSVQRVDLTVFPV
jgi:hypothetical protein